MDKVGIAVSNVPEDGDGHSLLFEKPCQVSNQFTDPFGRHDDIIHIINRLLLVAIAVQRGIERLARFPNLVTLLLTECENRIGRQSESAAYDSYVVAIIHLRV